MATSFFKYLQIILETIFIALYISVIKTISPFLSTSENNMPYFYLRSLFLLQTLVSSYHTIRYETGNKIDKEHVKFSFLQISKSYNCWETFLFQI